MNAFGIVSLPAESRPIVSTFRPGHYTLHEGRARYTSFLARTVASFTAGPVLDVGCGAGHLLNALANHGIPATGFDVSAEIVLKAARNSPAKVLRHDANEAWPFEDGAFHAVTMFDVIEHLAAYDNALEESRRVLKSNGSLFVVTVNRASILRWFLGSKWGALRDPEHVVYFDRSLLESALRHSGFQVQESRTFFNLSVAGESAAFLRPFRKPGIIVFWPELGDSIYVRARRLQ